MKLGLEGRRALVYASSRGLGYACALGLAKEGCDLVITSRDQARIENAAEQIRAATGANVHAVATNVGHADAAQTLIDACVERYGGLEIAIHNAGGPPAGGFDAVTVDQWSGAFDQNLMSFVHLVPMVAPPQGAH